MSRRDWRYYVALGGLICGLSGYAVLAQVQDRPKAENAARNAQGGREKLSPAAVAPSHPPSPKQQSEATAKEGIELGSWPDWAIVVFTAFLAWLSWRQYRLETKLAKEGGEALGVAKQSADAATAAAKAAGKANEIAHSNARDQIRAYVHAERAEVRWGDAKGRSPRITVVAKNTGQTPAKWFGASVKIHASPAEERLGGVEFSTVDLSDRPLIRWSSLGGLGDELSFAGEKEGDLGAFRDAFDNQKTLNVRGVIRYCTIFDEIFETEFWFSRRPEHWYRQEMETREEGGMTSNYITEIPHVMPRTPVALRTYRRIE